MTRQALLQALAESAPFDNRCEPVLVSTAEPGPVSVGEAVAVGDRFAMLELVGEVTLGWAYVVTDVAAKSVTLVAADVTVTDEGA